MRAKCRAARGPTSVVLRALPHLWRVGALVSPLGEFCLLCKGNCGFNKSPFLTSVWSLKRHNSESSPAHMLTLLENSVWHAESFPAMSKFVVEVNLILELRI